MYSRKLKLLREKQAAAEAARKRVTGASESPEEKDRRMRRLYGRGQDEMAESCKERAWNFTDTVTEAQVSSLLHNEYQRPTTKESFRPPREPERELGRSFLSSQRYIPTRSFRGGGIVDLTRTQSLEKRPSTAFASSKELPRLPQPPYRDAATMFQYKYGMRQRHKDAEIAGPMRYRPRTESERIQQVIASRLVSSASDPWEPPPTAPTFRTVDKAKWTAKDFTPVPRSRNSDIERRTISVSGGAPVTRLDEGVPWAGAVEPPQRKRVKEKEVSKKLFRTIVHERPLQRVFPDKERPDLEGARLYSQSMRTVPSQLGGTGSTLLNASQELSAFGSVPHVL